MNLLHTPVLLTHVISVLAPKPGERYIDGTAGYGGHAKAILDIIGPDGSAILVDRDIDAITALRETFTSSNINIHHDTYLDAAKKLVDSGEQVDMILLDIGVSSPQIDNSIRGFSFKSDATLDMRMNQDQSLTAADVVNTYSKRALENILHEYGEEPKARAVAAAIFENRPFNTTFELAEVVRRFAYRPKDIDAATRSFQAIRIETNEELTQLKLALPEFVKVLAPNGRIAVISFHSLEDRIVKQFFDTESRDCVCPPKQPICTCNHMAILQKITSKPLTGDSTEIVINPRARSAKLRAAKKQNQK